MTNIFITSGHANVRTWEISIRRPYSALHPQQQRAERQGASIALAFFPFKYLRSL